MQRTLLTSGEYIDLLHAVLTGEEHTAKETADIGDILDRRVAGSAIL